MSITDIDARDTGYDDKKLDLTEHLDELRRRIVRAAAYMLLGFVFVYGKYDALFRAVASPLEGGLREIARHAANGATFPPGTLVFSDFTGPFMLRIHLSMIGGVIVAVPFIVLEIWGFVEPALTPSERKPFRLMAPFAVFLFLCGLALGYTVLPFAVRWFLSFLADYPNAVLLQDPQNYIVFFAKILLAFGLVFQLPVVLVALGKFGLVRSRTLVQYWRYVIVAITVLAMLISPSADPTSMLLLAVPLAVLFALSIGLVKLVEPKQEA
ncbi:MAG: twin-arginine translocase subunit TatC [Capsulimonadaceae bacterium]|nr:twin-arginine translocase subunit TatC [Capsulimonadaceae bacterium]